MGCGCSKAAKAAVADKRVPELNDAFDDEAIHKGIKPVDAYKCGVRSGVLWASERAKSGSFTALGQRHYGVVTKDWLTMLAQEVLDGANQRT